MRMPIRLIAALNVVMVRFLWQAHFGFKAQHLLPVLTIQAVHNILPGHALFNPVLEGIKHQIVVVQITRLDELQTGVVCGDFIGLVVNPVHQNARKQKVRKDDDALEPKHGALFQRWHHQRERHARVSRLGPAKTQAFPQHAGDLGDVAVGIRVRRAATDNNQQRLMRRDFALLCIGALHRFAHTLAGGADHLVIDTQLAAIVHFDVVLRTIGVQDRGDIVLGVTRREQHARNSQNPLTALFPQTVQTVFDDRRGEFEIAVVHVKLWEPRAQAFSNLGKLANCPFITATVAAHHYACLHFPSAPQLRR